VSRLVGIARCSGSGIVVESIYGLEPLERDAVMRRLNEVRHWTVDPVLVDYQKVERHGYAAIWSAELCLPLVAFVW
jgi:hypothetical protein